MATTHLPILDFVASNYRNFNSRATRDALGQPWESSLAKLKRATRVADDETGGELFATLFQSTALAKPATKRAAKGAAAKKGGARAKAAAGDAAAKGAA
jgi:hypothetical protein